MTISTLSRRNLIAVFERLAVEDFHAFHAFIRARYPQAAVNLQTHSAAILAESTASVMMARGLVGNDLLDALETRFGPLVDLRVLREELGALPMFTHRDPATVNALVDLCIKLKLHDPFPVAPLRTNYRIAERVGVDYSRDPAAWLRESAKRANHAETPDLIEAWMSWATNAKPEAFAPQPAPVAPPPANAWELLRTFLVGAFSVEEMRRLVRNSDELHGISCLLPEGSMCARDMADELTRATRNERRLLDLLDVAARERPRRAAEIEAIRLANR